MEMRPAARSSLAWNFSTARSSRCLIGVVILQLEHAMNPNNGLIFKVLSTGRDSLGLNISQKMVLLVLLEHWNPSKSGAMCWPGQDRISDLACLSRSSAHRALQELEQCGYIKIRLVPGRSNRYQLDTAFISQACDPCQPDTPNSSNEGGTHVTVTPPPMSG